MQLGNPLIYSHEKLGQWHRPSKTTIVLIMFFVFSEFGMSLDLSGYNLFLLKLKTEN